MCNIPKMGQWHQPLSNDLANFMPARCLSSSVAMIRNFWFTSGLRTLVGHTLPLCAWQSLSEHGRICWICPKFLTLSAEENCIQTIICWDWAPNAVSFSCCNRFRKESRQACSSGSASAVACLGSFMIHDAFTQCHTISHTRHARHGRQTM